MSDRKRYIDFNIDIGLITDENQAITNDLIDLVSSVNINCGFSEDSPIAMKKAIQQCKFKNKVVGANIFLPDSVQNPSDITADELDSVILYQLGSISAFAESESMNIEYVRPCGKMHRFMVENYEFCLNVAKSVKKFNKWFLLYCATCENLEKVANEIDINVVREISLCKPYKQDGLVDFDGAEISDNGLLLIRLRRLMNLSEIENVDSEYVKVPFDTIHFDFNADYIEGLLKEAGEVVCPRPVNFNRAALSGWVD